MKDFICAILSQIRIIFTIIKPLIVIKRKYFFKWGWMS